MGGGGAIVIKDPKASRESSPPHPSLGNAQARRNRTNSMPPNPPRRTFRSGPMLGQRRAKPRHLGAIDEAVGVAIGSIEQGRSGDAELAAACAIAVEIGVGEELREPLPHRGGGLKIVPEIIRANEAVAVFVHSDEALLAGIDELAAATGRRRRRRSRTFGRQRARAWPATVGQ